MAKLEGQKIADSYEQLLHTDRDGGGNGTTLVDIKDGKNDNTFALKLATDKVRIEKLGIATDSPSVALDVSGQLKVETNSDGATAGVIRNTHATGYGLKINGASDSTRYALTINSNDDNTTFMRVLGNGNVGIATASPTAFLTGSNKVLQVDGEIVITGTNSSKLVLGEAGNSLSYVWQHANLPMLFGTNNTERMRIDASGNVGIGSAPNSFVYFYKDISNQSTWHTDGNSHLVISNPSSTSGTSAILKLAGKQSRITYGLDADTDSLTFTSRQSASSTTEVIHFDNNANLAIGHTSPDTNLHISGAGAKEIRMQSSDSASRLRIEGATQADIVLKDTAGGSNTKTMQQVIMDDVFKFRTLTDAGGIGIDPVLQMDLATGDISVGTTAPAYVHAQNVPNHVANTMSSPYYRFDGVNDEIAVADNDILSFSANSSDLPFSISAWIYMEDTNIFSIATKNDTGLGEYRFLVHSEKLQFLVADADASAYEFAETASAVTSYANQWIHVVATYNGVGGTSANAGITMYINGVSQTLSINGANTYVAMDNTSHEFRIGNLHNSNYARGSIACLRVWNKELTATEVKDDYSGMSVPFKYKGANKTSLVTGASSDMSGAGSWNFAYLSGSNNNSTVAGKMYLLGNGNDDMAFIGSVLTIGKAYTFSLKARLNSGSSTAIRFGNNLNTAGSYVEFTPTGTEQTFTGTFLAVGADVQIGTTSAMGGMSGVAFEIDDVLVYPAGAVAEYDGSGAGETIWGDKSGNDLHGTVSGATLENTPYNDRTEYETGLFTPVLSDGSNNATSHASTKGIYTRTGNCVSFNMYVRITSKGSISGALRVTGLPYTAGNDEHFYSGINVGYGTNLSLDNARETVTGYVEYGNSYITLQNWDATTGTGSFTADDTTDTSQLMIRGQYWVSD